MASAIRIVRGNPFSRFFRAPRFSSALTIASASQSGVLPGTRILGANFKHPSGVTRNFARSLGVACLSTSPEREINQRARYDALSFRQRGRTIGALSARRGPRFLAESYTRRFPQWRVTCPSGHPFRSPLLFFLPSLARCSRPLRPWTRLKGTQVTRLSPSTALAIHWKKKIKSVSCVRRERERDQGNNFL